ELAAKELPDPPLLGWQQRTGRCLAELVDFKEHLDSAARAGLEGALEASGLLAAEVHRDALRLADGQVVIAPLGNEVAAPLSALLRPDAENGVDAETRGNVERILRAISTDASAGADTVVTLEGEFRLGSLCGRHLKREVEHIGVSARRATLERQRAQSALALAQAKEQCERLAGDVESARAALEYTLLALVLGSTVAGPAVISLRDLVERVRSAAVEADITLEDSPTMRRALVCVLQWMIELGLASELYQHVDAYAGDETADAVLKIRPERIALL